MRRDVIEVGGRAIGPGEPTFVVAEMACAHEGEAERAAAMIEALGAGGVDAIQLQLFRSEALIAESHPNHALVRRLELPAEAWRALLRQARAAGPQLWANIFDLASLELAVEAGVDLLKVHSTDVGHPELLEAVASTRLPVSLSAGGRPRTSCSRRSSCCARTRPPSC